MTLIANTPVIQALNASPMLIAEAVKNNPVAVAIADKPMFYCVNEEIFHDFLAWQSNEFYQKTVENKPKKSIRNFVGILKNETDVRLTSDELNEAIEKAGAKAGMQGIKKGVKK